MAAIQWLEEASGFHQVLPLLAMAASARVGRKSLQEPVAIHLLDRYAKRKIRENQMALAYRAMVKLSDS